MKLLRGYIWLALAFFGWGCSGNLTNLNPTQAQVSAHRTEFATGDRVAASPVYVAGASRFRGALYALSANPNNAALAAQYLDAGIAVSRFNCDDHFRLLTERGAQFGFAAREANLAGGVASAAMGLANAAASSIAGLGVGMALLHSSLSNYTDNFIPSPDLPGLQKLVLKAQAALEAELSANPPTTYGAAESALLTFDQVCSFNGMKMLVNDSVQRAEPTVAPQPASAVQGRLRAMPSQSYVTPVLEIR